MNNRTPRIALTVVTRNRLSLLQRCIGALRMQAVPETALVVVNNGSTDGTEQWLASQGDIVVITQGNLGSAGGQKTAMEYAVQNGFDAVFTMDDDCFPQHDALTRILAAWMAKDDRESWVLNSLVLDPDVKGAMSFGLWDGAILGVRHAQTFYQSLSEVPPSRIVGNLYTGWGCVFNGTLVPTALLKKIGYPRAEFFIRGDEVEFFYRVRRHGNIATVTDSIVWHPGAASIDETLPNWKRYFSVRNEVIINREYFPSIKTTKLYLGLRALRYRILAAVTREKEVNRVMAIAISDALNGDFSRDAFNQKT